MLLREVKSEVLFCPICRTPLNIIALAGISSGSEVEISTEARTQHYLLQGRRLVTEV